MNCTVQEILQYVREEDVKFIRLAFCDIFGRQSEKCFRHAAGTGTRL